MIKMTVETRLFVQQNDDFSSYLDSTNSSWTDNTDILFVCLLVQGSRLRLGNAFSNDCDSLDLVQKFSVSMTEE